MPYDPNGFNYKGDSIISLYDTTIANINVKSSGFTKNGTDIATQISPATHHAWYGSSTGTMTSGTYTGFGSDQISFDNAFSLSTRLMVKHRIDISSQAEKWTSGDYNCARFNSNGKVYFRYCKFVTSGASTHGGPVSALSPIAVVVVGGGGGGKMAYFQGYGSGGPGGGGGGAVVYCMLYMSLSLTELSMEIGSGGHGQTSWTSSLAGYNAYDGGDTQFYPTGYKDWAYFITAKGGAHGRYNDETASTAEGSTSGAAPSGSDIHTSFTAASVNGTGYELGIYTSTTSTTSFAIHDIENYRNKGGDSNGYGWAGGGGGGAGGVGGVMHGDYNQEGGNGGASISLLGRSWAGGGGGGRAAQTGYADGSHGGGNADGFGGGGNSTGLFSGTENGKNGGIAIGVKADDYELGF